MKLHVVLAAMVSIGFSQNSLATVETWAGKVHLIQMLDDNDSDAGENQPVIVVTGQPAASALACPGGSFAGQTLATLRMRDRYDGQGMMSLALAAQAADRNVLISVDDTQKSPAGFCYVRYLRIENGR